MQVLICEDNKEIQELLEIIVMLTGNTVIKCDSLDKVDSVLKSAQADVIIMDYWFKNKDASETITRIKTSEKYGDVPVIIISAIPNLAEVAQNLNADAYIKKPFNVEDVKNIIMQFNKS